MNRAKTWVRRGIFRHKTQPSSSTCGRETLPIDLIIEILLRLPAESIKICRFVSKQWVSFLRQPDFTESFMTRSLSRPHRLLLTLRSDKKWYIFSAPQPQGFGENLSVVATKYHMSYSGSLNKEICQSVHGFIYLNYCQTLLRGEVEKVHVICNPCTGQYITLPRVVEGHVTYKMFFGYDPIQKQFKVLCRTKFKQNKNFNDDYHVLTLGTRELLWRKIECSFRHYPKSYNGICINGVIYYIAWIKNSERNIIVCFDVWSEKFSFVELMEKVWIWDSVLTNYKGKLGIIMCVDGQTHARLLVLDDTKEDKWSKHNFDLPEPFLKTVSIWASDTGEIVWASGYLTNLLYVFYYNLESKSIIRRVEVKGIVGRKFFGAFINFSTYVENVTFLENHD